MSNRIKDDYDEIIEVPNFDYNESGKKSGKKKKAKKKKDRKNSKFYKFTRVFSIIYLLALIAFESVLVVMDVLPEQMLIALVVVLSLLSVVLFVQLFFKNIKMWAKVLATFMSVILLAVYGLGSAYAMGTLSFLDSIDNGKNANSVNVTREPFNVLITGMDTFGSIDEPGRSDVNMIVTVNPKTGKILMTSIPRDYKIRMVNHGDAYDKLTHTGFYSVDDTIGAVEDLLDIKINYYVKVNFTAVMAFVDAIGGVDVYSDYAFTSAINDEVSVEEGWNHLDGYQALYFARERKAFEDGDNQRIKNQQAVFQAMLKKALSSKTLLLKYSKILTSISDYIEMNMSSNEVRALVKLQIAKNIDWNIEKYSVTGHDEYSGTYSSGSQEVYVMGQDEDSINTAHDKIEKVMGINEE